LITRERVTGRAARSRTRATSHGGDGGNPGPAKRAVRTWRQARARVVIQREYGAGFRWLELELPAGFVAPVAGQFVQLLLEFPSPVLLPRPMSVASVRRVRAKLRVGFLYAAVGAGTRALAELPTGAHVSVTGPLGRGYPLDEPGTPVLIAGGRGVAPLLMAAGALAQKRRRCEFVFGARTASLLVGLAEARARLGRARSRLHLATDDGSRGFRGDVVGLLANLAPKLAPPLVIHACGPHGMLAAVARWAIANGARAHLAMESVMACGTGVCRGCPLPRSGAARARVLAEGAEAAALKGNPEWAMCCTDGPVFEARELDWDRVE
jgi:dihydroorotate dehydrogenase electron transfer subunit